MKSTERAGETSRNRSEDIGALGTAGLKVVRFTDHPEARSASIWTCFRFL